MDFSDISRELIPDSARTLDLLLYLTIPRAIFKWSTAGVSSTYRLFFPRLLQPLLPSCISRFCIFFALVAASRRRGMLVERIKSPSEIFGPSIFHETYHECLLAPARHVERFYTINFSSIIRKRIHRDLPSRRVFLTVDDRTKRYRKKTNLTAFLFLLRMQLHSFFTPSGIIFFFLFA